MTDPRPPGGTSPPRPDSPASPQPAQQPSASQPFDPPTQPPPDPDPSPNLPASSATRSNHLRRRESPGPGSTTPHTPQATRAGHPVGRPRAKVRQTPWLTATQQTRPPSASRHRCSTPPGSQAGRPSAKTVGSRRVPSDHLNKSVNFVGYKIQRSAQTPLR